jgi:membrane protease YdiL (CAAX protease family)
MNASTLDKPFRASKPVSMSTKTLVYFFALTFGLTWGIGMLLVLFSEQLTAIFGEIGLSNPLIILAVYSPGISGVLLVWRHYGLKGLGSYFQRLTLWRAPLHWWLFILLGIPAVVYTGAAIKGTISDPFPFSPWVQALPALAVALFLGPIEEFGWRGLALPLLQRKFAPFWAGLILGVIWGVWHMPSFLMSGMPQSSWSLVPFFLGIVAISVILTPLFNTARGSLLIAVLYHFQMMNPIFPDAQPWDNLLYVALAVIVVVLNRRKLFQRGAGVTDVLMPETIEP